MRKSAAALAVATLFVLSVRIRAEERKRIPTPSTATHQPFAIPNASGAARGIPRTLDVEHFKYDFVRYKSESDLPNGYTGFRGNRIDVAAGETVTRDNVAVGFYACCQAPEYEQIWDWKIYGPDASGNPTIEVWSARSHQTTDQYGRPCWDGLFCGATSVDYLPWMRIGCTHKLGNYKAQVIYQKRDWSTSTMTPPEVIFERTWKLGPRLDSLSVSVERTQLRAGITYGKMFGSVQRPEGEKAKLTVTAYDCAPLANIPVTIKREYVPESGGHLHLVSGNTTPPVEDILDIAASSGVTNANGTYTTEVKGMNIAGHLKITAESTGVQPGVTTKSQPFGLHVGFNNLVSIAPLDEPDLAGYLRLTGHNAATCTGTGCDNHRDLSHYAAPEMAGFLLDMAKEYNDIVGPAVIGVNDISLPDGGLFDIDGNWSPSHWYHRIGCGVDIDKTAFNPETGTNVALNIYKLTKIVEALGGTKVPEGPVHYELPADVQDAVLGNAGWSYAVPGVTK